MSESENPILHVIVVGFHHKKGCQVEYSYPPLVPESPNECPPGWKYLPTLALPDGSHNFENDTAYFHLSSLTDPRKTVFGISCYRQIPVEKLKIKTDDITRSTVQKAVCVLSTLSLYGHIQVKMSLITHAYFEEGDFSKVTLLEDTYHHLNSCLSQTQIPSQIFVGLSARDLILQWRHKAVLLFKLLLLEKRLIFYKSPVQPLCSTILTLLSLHPGMIERGLDQSACVKPSRPMSPIPDFEESADEDGPNKTNPQNEIQITNPQNEIKKTIPQTELEKANSKSEIGDINTKAEITKTNSKIEIDNSNIKTEVDNVSITEQKVESISQNVTAPVNLNQNKMHLPSTTSKSNKEASSLAENMLPNNTTDAEKTDAEKMFVEGSGILGVRDERPTLPRDTSIDTLVDVTAQNTMTSIAHINAEECGAPLEIFTHGYLCFPYLSLPYMDLLSDCNVRGYVVGATNVLFKQKRQLSDVLIEVDGTRIESLDPELRRQLHLTTEDLRFADFVVKHVSEERHDVFLDGVGWEGGDEWIRSQFRVYLLCLLRTSLLQDNSREIEHFNSSFISAWKDTHNYKTWISGEHSNILELNPGHPFAGQLSVADMKLRLAHTMQNTESGRKINQAMVSTGRAVATTGRAVGGAFTQAKGALSNWWSNLTTVSPENDQMVDNEQNMENENNLPELGEDVVYNENQQNVLQDGQIDMKQGIEPIAQNQRIIESSDITKKSENFEVTQKNEVNVQNNLDDKNSRVHDELKDNVYKPGEINTV